VKQLVRFRSLDDSAHASIGQQIGELAVHHPKWHLHPISTEPVSLRPGVESDTLRTGDAYRMKLRLVLPTTTRAAGEEAEHVAHFSAFATIPAYPRKRARCIALCCWYCTAKQCAVDATKDDGLRLNLAAQLY
jgi:hypothetical protein